MFCFLFSLCGSGVSFAGVPFGSSTTPFESWDVIISTDTRAEKLSSWSHVYVSPSYGLITCHMDRHGSVISHVFFDCSTTCSIGFMPSCWHMFVYLGNDHPDIANTCQMRSNQQSVDICRYASYMLHTYDSKNKKNMSHISAIIPTYV